tara:strand:+ start:1264 stop:1737 length:474 start_codon:yes stop_codon:yes gene_type:complete
MMTTLIGIIKSIQILDKWATLFVVAYISHKIDKIEDDTKIEQGKRLAIFNAISAAKTDDDRRSLSIILKDHITKGTTIVLALFILTSCQTTIPSAYFERPLIIPAIANQCTGFINGNEVDITNNLCATTLERDEMLRYLEDIENRLYVCLKWPRRCK